MMTYRQLLSLCLLICSDAQSVLFSEEFAMDIIHIIFQQSHLMLNLIRFLRIN